MNAKIGRNVKRRLTFFGPIIIIIMIGCLVSIISCVYKIHELKVDEARLSEQLKTLQEQEKELSSEITKLNDPDYIAKYARENYYYTKKGEYVIKLDEDIEKEEEQIQIDTHKSYYIISIFLFALIFLLIILRKSNKKK